MRSPVAYAVLVIAAVIAPTSTLAADEAAADIAWRMVERDGRFHRVEMVDAVVDGSLRVRFPGTDEVLEVDPERVSGHPASQDPHGVAAFYLRAILDCDNWSHHVGNGGLDLSPEGPTASVGIIGPAGEGEERWLVEDAAGLRLLLDLVREVVEGAEGEGMLPTFYTFCPEDLFLGYADA